MADCQAPPRLATAGADQSLLKGALMLRVWGVPSARPAMDIDLLRRGVADQAALVRLAEQCAAISDLSDGVVFEPTTISVVPIRDATEYVRTRIRLHARLDNVRQTVRIDFGVGDSVHPQPQVIDYPVLLTSPPVPLNAYPVEAAIAEKFEAMVHLDMQNSRMKDFYDIWILSRTLRAARTRALAAVDGQAVKHRCEPYRPALIEDTIEAWLGKPDASGAT